MRGFSLGEILVAILLSALRIFVLVIFAMAGIFGCWLAYRVFLYLYHVLGPILQV